MLQDHKLSLGTLLRRYRLPIGLTWAWVVIENLLMALIPLGIGFAIDGLFAKNILPLWQLGALMVAITLIGVGRRIYDTRAYGRIRVDLAAEQDRRQQTLAVSTRSARIDMATELVDFLEHEIPELFTAILQLVVALVILSSFHHHLMFTSIGLLLAMLGVYGLFHGRFFNFNAALNHQMEQQVTILGQQNKHSLWQHLNLLRQHRIKLSDTEAIVFGLIFLLIISFMLYNLWVSVGIPEITPGRLFTLVNYCWQFAESAIMLPVTLQSWSRLAEITERLNQTPIASDQQDATSPKES